MRSGPNSVHFRLRIVGLKIRAVMKPGLRFWVDEPYFWIGEPFFWVDDYQNSRNIGVKFGFRLVSANPGQPIARPPRPTYVPE